MAQPVDVILLSGGKGTRFYPITLDQYSKSLYKLNNLELIGFSIKVLDFSLVNNLIFAINHHSDGVKGWVKEQDFPCKVLFSTQTEPGVLGAVKAAEKLVTTDSFLVCNTDEIRDGLSMRRLVDAHDSAPHLLGSLATAYSDRLFYHGVVETDDNGIVLSTDIKNQQYRNEPELVKEIHAGFMLFRREAVKYFNPEKYDNEWSGMTDALFEKRLVQAVLNPDVVFHNVGTVSELEDARQYLSELLRPAAF